jgi:hypothetical protein
VITISPYLPFYVENLCPTAYPGTSAVPLAFPRKSIYQRGELCGLCYEEKCPRIYLQ